MKKTTIIGAICLLLLPFIYLQCKKSNLTDARGSLYAGSATCIKCHSNIYHSYLHTAHYLAARPASPENIHGSFAVNENVFQFSPSQKIVMEKRVNELFQTYYKNGKAVESRRFDIVMGGVKGESYLYWNGNGLNQLPASYYTKEHQWLLSPRFDPRYVNFNRTITSRCLECHASYVSDQPGENQGLKTAEQFDKSTLIFSVDCERCHGPGAQHVDYQTDNPIIKTARFIARYSSLPRARRLDMCAVCHSGNKSEMLQSTFSFVPGDTLANFKLPGYENAANDGKLDVHGNQLQLLQSSKCFINSKMDCATCHDVHQNQRGNTVAFVQKCSGCHSTATHNYCKMESKLSAQFLNNNCIACHMPAFPSVAIVANAYNKTPSANVLVTSHHIAIYPDEVKKILAMVQKK